MKTSKTRKAPKTNREKCCSESTSHPDHSEFLPRLNRIQGQLTGIQKMIQDRRYCVDILIQFRASMAALRGVEVSIFESHLQHCLSTALLSHDQKQIDEKIKELSDLLSRRTIL